MKLREIEGLHGLDYQKHIDTIIMCYGALADKHMFPLWIAHAMQCRADFDADHIRVMEAWAKHPTKFPVWGCRIPA